MKEYEINLSTIAIIAINDDLSNVIEENNSFFIYKSAFKIIDSSCRYFGSSYNGRVEGTKHILGINYKAPVVIEETNNIIFFPTSSPRLEKNTWISLNHIDTYKKNSNNSIINFKNGKQIFLEISYNVLENQILRATRLEAVLRKRKTL